MSLARAFDVSPLSYSLSQDPHVDIEQVFV